ILSETSHLSPHHLGTQTVGKNGGSAPPRQPRQLALIYLMSEQCSHNCSSCGEQCGERTAAQTDFTAPLGKLSTVKKVVAIVSGKGGVGKSLVTGLLASYAAKQGKKTAILDADITGPSIPKMFGIHGQPTVLEQGLVPMSSHGGVDIVSMNMLLPDASEAVLWRGPILAGVVKQFWSEAIWKDIDLMFVDMPPGTGDIPLTVFQSLPVDGIIIVTSPQDLVTMIVEKAIRMAKIMDIPIIGLVENMSYFVCPDNGKSYQIFGESKTEAVAHEQNIPLLDKLPIDPLLAAACDRGEIENYTQVSLANAFAAVEKTPKRSK
ncbi:MAG: Mrp/NBP35 family ATP-binding protein, partial [Desulfovibrio sp.]|nr:Mrp/NBP35 family ATP-binding protein [Desulfovibrio sp.]